MGLFLVKIFFLCLIQGFSARTFEDREDLGQISSENETEMGNLWEVILEDQPSGVLVELSQPLVENIKAMRPKENRLNISNKNLVLATFDSTGLMEVSSYNDTPQFVQALTDLKPTTPDRQKSPATLHAVAELVRNNLSDGSVLLVTMSEPSDVDFKETLIESLMKKNLRLSVFWLGSQNTNENRELKDIARRTGGKFEQSSAGLNSDEDSIENGYIQKSNFENVEKFSETIRFPENQNESEGKDMPLVLRAADQKSWHKVFVPLIVEVASGTSLEMRPGAPTQIQFNVKNNINAAVPVFFTAKFNGINQNVQPPQTVLQPSASVTVIVNLQPMLGSTSSAIGTLTLVAAAANRVTARSALISLTPQTDKDKTDPKLYHRYEGDCSNYKEPQNCENGHWSLEATIHDEDSGLLKIMSEPYGLLFQSEFIAGTKTPVTVTYTATCCQPIVHIWAEDLRGNYVKKSFDVFNQNLLAGEIASIVLGVLLLLLIIIVIIAAIIFVRRRNRRNMIIPRPRSGSR